MHPLVLAALIETAIYFGGFLPAACLLCWLPVGKSVGWTLLFLYLAYHLSGIAVIFLAGLAIRLLPKPQGATFDMHADLPNLDPDAYWFLVLLSLSTIPYRTLGRFAATIWPLPALLYFGVAGADIHPTVAVPPHVVLLDPYLLKVGARTVLGDGCKLSPHAVMGPGKIRMGPITIGADCVIGGDVTVGPNVEIGDGATVVSGSGVIPGSRIGAGEVWSGSPARRVSKAK